MTRKSTRRPPRKKPVRPKFSNPSPVKTGRANIAITVFFLLAMGGFGWWWQSNLTCKAVHIYGARISNPETLRHLAGIDSSMLFFDIIPHLVAERVSQDPWVESAEIKRLPNAEIAISVKERVPSLLLIDNKGKPERFLDTYGFQMPFRKEAVFDIPILTGLPEEYLPDAPIQHESTLQLLNALQHINSDIDALISAFTVEPSGELTLHTAPKPGRGSIDVRLGHGNYGSKLSKLHAFWHQEVLRKQQVNIELIDLRFDSQIITKEVRLSQ